MYSLQKHFLIITSFHRGKDSGKVLSGSDEAQRFADVWGGVLL
jgi:hypothetical protein